MKVSSKKGFTLTEFVISSSLTLIISSMAISFLYTFTGYTNQALSQNNIDSDLRSSEMRLEKEIINAKGVLQSYTIQSTGNVITTNSNRLIVKVASNIIGSKDDIVVIEYQPNEPVSSSDTLLTDIQNGNLRKLRLSVYPGDPKSRSAIKNQSIVTLNSKDSNGQDYKLFTYYKDDGINEISDNSTDLLKTSIIKINMWSRTQGKIQFVKKELNFRLRNYSGV